MPFIDIYYKGLQCNTTADRVHFPVRIAELAAEHFGSDDAPLEKHDFNIDTHRDSPSNHLTHDMVIRLQLPPRNQPLHLEAVLQDFTDSVAAELPAHYQLGKLTHVPTLGVSVSFTEAYGATASCNYDSLRSASA